MAQANRPTPIVKVDPEVRGRLTADLLAELEHRLVQMVCDFDPAATARVRDFAVYAGGIGQPQPTYSGLLLRLRTSLSTDDAAAYKEQLEARPLEAWIDSLGGNALKSFIEDWDQKIEIRVVPKS